MKSSFGLYVRPFDGDVLHAAAIADFLGRSWDFTGTSVGWHPGEFYWNAFRASSPTFFASVEQDGRMLAFVYYRAPGEIEFVVERSMREPGADVALVREIARIAVAWPNVTGPVSITVAEQDDWMAAVAGELGFANTGRAEFRSNSLALSGQKAVSLREGFRLVEMGGSVDLDERVQLHRDVWQPSTFDRAEYDHLRESAGYRSDLDIAAVADDGTFASYAIGWFDPVSRIGQLEPVGTRAQFRGMGLGKAVISTVLNRMQEIGAIGCCVLSEDDGVAANALYQSVGFRPTTRLEIWTRNPV